MKYFLRFNAHKIQFSTTQINSFRLKKCKQLLKSFVATANWFLKENNFEIIIIVKTMKIGKPNENNYFADFPWHSNMRINESFINN